MSFWSELKRRNVFKVAVAYLIVAWLILQVVSIIFPMFHMPVWTGTFVAVLLIVGFPLVLIFAWAFEITPEGLKLTKDVPHHESITHLTGQKLNYILIGVIVLAVAYILFDNMYLDRLAIESESPPAETAKVDESSEVEAASKTIAVLPFENLSSDPEQQYFVDGLSEEILNTIAQIEGLRVTSRTSSFAFRGSGKTIQEIAGILGVENILEGSVRKAGDSLRITAQLIRVKNDSHLWSGAFDRKLKDIFAVQEDIASAVAKELKVTLGIDRSFRQPGGTDNVAAYSFYMVAQGQISDTEYSGAMASLDSALEIDPDFPLAWASKATLHIFNTVLGPTKDVALQREKGFRAATKAIDLSPNLADGYYALGYEKTTGGDFIAGREAYLKALELSDKPLSFIVPVVAIHYQAVGYFDKERKLIEEMLQNDPLNQGTRAFYIICLGLVNESEKAEEEYELERVLFGDTVGSYSPGITIARLGAGGRISSDQLIYSDPAVDAVKTHLDSPEEGLSELHRLYADADELSAMSLAMMALGAAYFGDPEFAMETLEKAVSNVGDCAYMLWEPVMHDVRKLPRFKEFVKEIGLVDYWNQFGWPDICHKLDNGDFHCD